MKDPLDGRTLRRLIEAAGCEPRDFVRTGDKFDAAGLHLSEEAEIEEVVALLLDNPGFMQRPIVAAGDRAVVARPAEKVLELL